MDVAGVGAACWHVAIDLCPEVQRDGWDIGHGIPDALAHDAGLGPAGEFQRSHFRHSPCRSATNPKAPSGKPSKESGAVHRGSMVVAAIWLPLQIPGRKPPTPIVSNLSWVDMRGCPTVPESFATRDNNYSFGVLPGREGLRPFPMSVHISTDKRASSDQPIGGEKPTSQY
jgi:hypothetical protein